MGEFDEYKEGIITIQLNGKTIRAIPTVEEAFSLHPYLKKIRDCDERAISRASSIIVDMIARANPSEDVNAIKRMVALNSTQLVIEVLIGLKIITREDLNDDEEKKTKSSPMKSSEESK